MAKKISRREFVISAIAVSCISIVGGAFFINQCSEELPEESKKLLELSKKDFMKKIEHNTWFIGKEYVNNNNPGISIDQITKKLKNVFDYLHHENGEAEVINYIGTLIQNDFKQNRVVFLHNWMLSMTEVHLCAFVYLSNK